MKNCSNKNCKQTNPQEFIAFRTRVYKNGVKAFQSWCKVCIDEIKRKPIIKEKARETTKKYRSKPGYKEKTRSYRLLRDYGLTLEKYNLMLSDQNHKCKICKKDEVEVGTLCVDHNHETRTN
jgi:hypothetical protein